MSCHGAYLTAFAGAIDSEFSLEQLIPAGESVVAVGRSRGKVRANGNVFDIPVVHVWTLRDKRVVKFESYVDTPTMLAALEGQSAQNA